MRFPKMTIDVLPRLTRFDLDFDIPEEFLPDKAPPIYLTTRSDLGDVSKGKGTTVENWSIKGKHGCDVAVDGTLD
jgi:hypothetical protein